MIRNNCRLNSTARSRVQWAFNVSDSYANNKNGVRFIPISHITYAITHFIPSENNLKHEKQKSDVTLCYAKTNQDAFNLSNCARECRNLQVAQKALMQHHAKSVALRKCVSLEPCVLSNRPDASDEKLIWASSFSTEIERTIKCEGSQRVTTQNIYVLVSLEQSCWTHMSNTTSVVWKLVFVAVADFFSEKLLDSS